MRQRCLVGIVLTAAFLTPAKACKLRLAVDGMSPGGETGYVNVSAFGKSGEAAARVLSKGWLVAVL